MKQNALHRRRGKRQLRTRAAHRSVGHTPRLVWQLALSGILFVALIALKLLMPGHLSAARGTLGQWLVNDADFAAAFSAVGRAAGGEETLGSALSEACAAVFGGDAQEVSAGLDDLAASASADADAASQRALPARVVGEERDLGFACEAPLFGTLTSGFGWREDPTTGEEAFHYGLDLAGEEGDTIRCFADGTVAVVGESTILGNYLTVDHANGYSTLYAHCSAVTAQSGQTVSRGEPIALVGATGNATGAHLHFELHAGSDYLDPVYYVAAQS